MSIWHVCLGQTQVELDIGYGIGMVMVVCFYVGVFKI
jgi:hypothetical protein